MSEKIDLSGLSVTELKKLITKAEQLIEEKAEAQRVELLAEMREKAAAHGTTLEALLGVRLRRKSKSGPGASSGKLYRHPDDPTLIYRGKGPRPKWLKEAIEGGAKLEDFLVEKE